MKSATLIYINVVVRIGKNRTGWPKTRWADTFKRAAGGLWSRAAWDRSEWSRCT